MGKLTLYKHCAQVPLGEVGERMGQGTETIVRIIKE